MRLITAEKIFFFTIVRLISNFKPRWGTKVLCFFFKRWGMRFSGVPNYISSKTWFDGTNYALISIGKCVTISSYVRVLTHDWSLHTVAKSRGIKQDKPFGILRGVEIGDYTFVGTGSIVMPGAKIGVGCIIGAGTVVRGCVPDYSIYIGSPGKVVGSSLDYLEKYCSSNL